jgi:hypothetical protein
MTQIEIDSAMNVTTMTPLTDAQREQLRTSTMEQRREVAASRRQPASPADAKTALALYEKHKIEGASLIACNVILPAGTGIINCRVGSDHKQIRF